ncbi:protein phosphatase 1 regulatory subunit 12B [Hoplias malabaricus]|uniref:protein phosphatase 1 regulatory subunit 12B n=1 Tax=Hoplias malabaricus TaxID=27720 RepID=UPI0034633B34
MPVRDEEAESQRKAKFRQTRQTRRATQVDKTQYFTPLSKGEEVWSSAEAQDEHDRASRADASGVEGSSDRLGHTSSYTRRENRLASLSKTDEDSTSKDYKKMYEDALTENEKLKTRLEDSKQELVKIRSQLDRVTQKQDRISERSSVLESEKREKQALEKRVSDMEEELKVLTELKSDNQRLKDENGALIRVISKLSK